MLWLELPITGILFSTRSVLPCGKEQDRNPVVAFCSSLQIMWNCARCWGGLAGRNPTLQVFGNRVRMELGLRLS